MNKSPICSYYSVFMKAIVLTLEGRWVSVLGDIHIRDIMSGG